MEEKQNWTTLDSKSLYGIDAWGTGYFNINESGNLTITPKKLAQVDMRQLVDDLKERGIRTPILLRIMDIVEDRINLINSCFSRAIKSYGYEGKYRGVYPIKVNQQKHLVEKILDVGQNYNMGLECGSKPELLVALAMMSKQQSLLICNGFKDYEYIETAILSTKLGFETVVVVERISELDLIIKISERLQIQPLIGVRVRLESPSAGKWQQTTGVRSKFGLDATGLVECVSKLKKHNLLSHLNLLHFHIGSQIPSIYAIKAALKEGARFYTELHKMGASLKYLDVGGGLGVDYDGTGSSDSSANYREQEYANDVISIIQSECDERKVPHPVVISESGRSLTAHHSVLVFDILGASKKIPTCDIIIDKTHPPIIHELKETLEQLSENKNLSEFFNDLRQYRTDVSQLFTYGVLNLEHKQIAEVLITSISTKLLKLAKEKKLKNIVASIEKDLVSVYFANFSVFQSVPDIWAIRHVFPVLPIQRLNEEPTNQATLADITCDCDGRIDSFIQNGSHSSTLKLHDLTDEAYYVGIFLIGAYQEILGDLHNLFGDTDAVSISVDNSGYHVEEVESGDTVGEILSYIQYNRSDLVQRMRQATEKGIKNKLISSSDAKLLMRHYEDGLSGYSYLE